ncbi:CPBP family intramembrane glutamic endopeptidase [Faecalibacter macacae]|uniref:CPBP family intramembrane metalloprotease n=1 Tax=Faecalibacter macacae TaxID=1859289 RepID=A0A3L9MNP3_9FLAO|nr:type II CAAX endopeptidase family protein [Faecalibacter macacae]RLZ12279.1 CPBP family intramembrane metalloprotease [Faecalibacter macacae]
MNNTDNLKITDSNPFSFGIVKAVFYSIIAVFTMQIIGGIIQLPAFFYPILNHVLLPLSFLVGICTAIGALLAILKTNAQPIIAEIKHKVSITEMVLAVFIWIGFLPLCEYFTTLIPTDGPLEELYKQFESSFEMLLNYKLAGFLMVCIFAPIFEEVIFRGIILRGMLNAKVTPIVAIAISGLIFGSAHLNPWQFVGAGLLGAIFGYVYYRTKSLALPIILHALNNSLSYFIMMQDNSMNENIFDTTDFVSIGIFTAFAIVLSFILYRITQKNFNNNGINFRHT